MIDLTPLDVRQKRGDFKKAMRGYETGEVDTFLDLVAERMEELVKENLALRERTTMLQAQVELQIGRERAVQDALVSAQGLRDEIKGQARREAEAILREADLDAKRIVSDADRRLTDQRAAMDELERKREVFLISMRRVLERGLDAVTVEMGHGRLENAPLDLHLRGGQSRTDGAHPGTTGPNAEESARAAGGPVKGELWLGLAERGSAPEPDPEPAS